VEKGSLVLARPNVIGEIIPGHLVLLEPTPIPTHHVVQVEKILGGPVSVNDIRPMTQCRGIDHGQVGPKNVLVIGNEDFTLPE